jgi:hypothetical protein
MEEIEMVDEDLKVDIIELIVILMVLRVYEFVFLSWKII